MVSSIWFSAKTFPYTPLGGMLKNKKGGYEL